MDYKCAIYVRTATINNEGLLQHGRQLELCKRFVRDNGYELYNIYQDIVGGLKLNRSALQELLNDVSDGKINTIVMTDTTRFVRNRGLLTLIHSFLEDNNIRITSLD
ncbi:recombinase family protein [Oceanobacillus senegalensis]|uniref:recombinase family protein n=1 Tax=Oceanobacillus senegalensis TaxID=1936063 RepID=UPI0015C49EFF|nr:recombinase family protein [Oceanobacillus senegalensis]